MNLLNGKKSEQEFIAATEKLSLDDLYNEAKRYGELTTGGAFSGANSAQITLNFVGHDYVCVKSRTFPTLHENIAECISKARKLKVFYKEIN